MNLLLSCTSSLSELNNTAPWSHKKWPTFYLEEKLPCNYQRRKTMPRRNAAARRPPRSFQSPSSPYTMEARSCPKEVGGLVDILSEDHRVKIMYYVFGETIWANFIRDFIQEILKNRSQGLIRLVVKHYDDPEFSWVFSKKDVCPIGLVDGLGHVFELGSRSSETRYLKHAKLTNYGKKYKDLLIGGTIVGTTLSAKIFEEAQMMVSKTAGEPDRWRHSIGVTSLMICEPAKFVGYRDVLAKKFEDGTELFLAGQGDGPYDWLAFIPNKWVEFSKCARRFVSTGPVRYDPQTLLGACECSVNPTSATKALLVRSYDPVFDGFETI